MFEKNALGANARQMKIQFSRSTLKIIAAVLVFIGTIGVIVEHHVLNIGDHSRASLLEAMEKSPDVMFTVTMVLLCTGIAAMAIPVYTHLLIEGYKHTSSKRDYFVRLLVMALVTEVPYDIAMQNTWFETANQNPVFGLMIALMLVFSIDYASNVKKFKGVLLRMIMIAAACLWCLLLCVDHGIVIVLVTVVMWIMDGQGALKTFLTAIVALIGLTAPFGLIFNHFYNGEKGKTDNRIFYFVYPAQLLILGLIGKFLP